MAMRNTPLISLALIFSLFFSACEKQEELELSNEKINIAYAEELSDFSPLGYEAKNRRYLANIYETLVRYDKTFNYEPSLALSWGRIDDVTWEFNLRKDVLFHDQSTFEAADFIYSIESAMNDSGLSSLLSNIESVEQSSDYSVQIKTYTADPLLLNKLINVYVMPDNFTEFEAPIGTAPYYFMYKNEDTLSLNRFESYWGEKPYYKEVDLIYIPDPEDRLSASLEGRVQFLVNVPPQYVNQLKENDFIIAGFPSLEVSYLMFNFDGALQDLNLREAIWNALGTDYAQQFGAGHLRSTSQYAATGIFGYIPDPDAREKNIERAMEYRTQFEDDVTLKLAIPEGLESLASQISSDLAEIDVIVEADIVPSEIYEDRILSGEADMYFFGWKYDLADSADFFESVAHTKDENFGSFNGMNYSNETVDSLIEEASTVLDVKERRNTLLRIMNEVIRDRIGVPLFEAELIYGISPNISWDTRLDGQVLAGEIR